MYQYDPFDIIAMTQEEPLGYAVFINDSFGYLYTTVYLAVMLQASWHTVEVN